MLFDWKEEWKETLCNVLKLFFPKNSSALARGLPKLPSEWSIIAIMFLEGPNEQFIPISLATGVKCLTFSDLALYSNEDHYPNRPVVSDMHAEVLVRRGLLHFLCEWLTVREDARTYPNILLKNPDDGTWKWNEKDYSLHMYTSYAPCGDCTMELYGDGDEGDVSKRRKLMVDDEAGWPVIRGREQSHLRGPYIRTKPGRVDSPLTPLRSCSDKLGSWQKHGLLNSPLKCIFSNADSIRLASLAVSHGFVLNALNRSFTTRAQGNEPNFIDLSSCTRVDEIACNYRPTSSANPCPTAVLYVLGNNPDKAALSFMGGSYYREVLSNVGLKQGASIPTKKKPILGKGVMSIVSRAKLYPLIESLVSKDNFVKKLDPELSNWRRYKNGINTTSL